MPSISTFDDSVKCGDAPTPPPVHPISSFRVPGSPFSLLLPGLLPALPWLPAKPILPGWIDLFAGESIYFKRHFTSASMCLAYYTSISTNRKGVASERRSDVLEGDQEQTNSRGNEGTIHVASLVPSKGALDVPCH